MKTSKIPEEYINWINNSLTNRKITLTNGNYEITKTTSNSLPQGDPLSPDLFNIYTSKLHEIEKENINILQYADDFLLIISAIDEKEGETIANNEITNLFNKLKELNLNINTNKTSFMNITNKRKTGIIKIKINNTEIKETNQIKILGHTIDKKLNFQQHYKNLKNSCINAINIIKIFGRKNGGAHPTTLLNLHKSLIENRIRYSIITNTNQQNKNIIQKVINRSLRACLGLTNSTPITAVIAEAGDLPINLKIEFYNYTYAAKKIHNNTKEGDNIKKGKTSKILKDINNKYKETLDKLPIIDKESYKISQENKRKIYIDTGIQNKIKGKNNINRMELKEITTEYIRLNRGQNISYTDGSIIDNRRGIGIYNSYNNETHSYQICENVSIKTVEIIAIFESIKLAIKNKIIDLTIITDSLSSCESLKNKITKDKYYEQQIYKITEINNIKLKIIWIPGHINIRGNEQADEAAKIGTTTQNILNNIKTPIKDNIRTVKQKLYEQWKEEFNNRTTHKGIQHRINIKEIKMKPWFQKTKMEIGEIQKITRLRTNHTYDKKYLKLIGQQENDICEECNTKEDAKHIIEKCSKFRDIRAKFRRLTHRKLEEILAEEKPEEYEEIIKFLREIKITI